LQVQMAKAEAGDEVMNVFRDPIENEQLALFSEYQPGGEVSRANLWVRQASQYSPVVPEIDRLYATATA